MRMSDPSSAQHPAGPAGTRKGERPHFRLVAGGILVALALVVVTLRFYRLSEIPPGLYSDSGAHGVDALQVLKGEHAAFFPANGGREGMIVYGVALSTALLGRTMLALRLPTALASAGTVFVVFWLGQLLFGRDERSGRATPWRGLLIGGVGAGLLAVSVAQTVLGRTAFRGNFLPLLLCLCLALLWRGWGERSCRGIVLAGVCAGLLPYTYTPARFTPFLFLLFGLSFLLPLGALTKERVRAELPRVAVFLGVTGLVAAPILIHFALHPDHFFMRSNEILILRFESGQFASLVAFLGNAWDHLMAFGFRGDPSWRHNFPGKPMLNPYEAFFFWLGVGMALWRWQRRPTYRLLLLWLVVLMLPAMLSRDDNVPHFLRMIGVAPAVYLLTGVGVWEAFRLLKERYRALAVRAASIFQENGTRAAIAVSAVVGGLILGQGVLTYRVYFEKWATAPELNWAYQVEWTEWAQMMNALPSEVNMVYLVPRAGSSGHNSFEFLYNGAASVHVIDTILPFLPQKVESALAAMEELSTVRVVDWNADAPWDHYEEEYIVALLSKFGRYLGSDEHAIFQIHTYADIALDRAWTYYEQLEPLTVVYDGGITLLGFALGQGEQQLSAQDTINLGTERSLWAALQMRTAPGLEIDYVISLRLHDAGGERVYQDDAPLMDLRRAHTSDWKADEPVDNLFHLEFPVDLPPGEYELRLVIYDSETNKPTVELDVWKPEFVLARLQLAELQ